MFLSHEEVGELTGRVRYTAQRRALRAMGIEHWVRPDGRPMVARASIDRPAEPRRRTKDCEEEPNGTAVNGS